MSTVRAGIRGVVLLVTLDAACAPRGPTPLSEADKAAMRQVADRALAMVTSPTRDWTAFATGFYAEDATVMPPNGPAVKGRDAIIAFLETYPPITEMKMVLQQVDGSGELAYDVETYTSMVTPPGRAATADTGKLVWVWQKQDDGAWRVLVEIWNSSRSAGTPSPEEAAQRH